MGRRLSVASFWLSMLGLVPLAPFLGAFLGLVSLLTSTNDPDSQNDLALWSIPIGLLHGLFWMAIFVGLFLDQGLWPLF